jgi:hypothetical protein
MVQSVYSRADWRTPEADVLSRMAKAHRAAIEEVSTGHLADNREDVIGAGLGEKLARTWRTRAFPREGRETLDPAALVYVNPGKGRRGNAPTIIDFYSAANVIRPILGEALAIPTKNTPRKSGGRGAKRFMSPVEVEARFNAELVPIRMKTGRTGLFIPVIAGLSTKKSGYRPATKGRIAQGRASELVHMFTLLRQVTGRKRLNHPAIASRWQSRFPSIVEANMKLRGF